MIEVKDLSFSYGRETPEILKRIAFSAPEGTITAILGNNGVGKSTLLKCLNRILKPQRGEILLDGTDAQTLSDQELAQRIAYVPQSLTRTDTTVYDMVLLGRKPYIRWDITQHDHKIVRGALRRLQLEDKMLRSISTLSGGEAQKVILARALAQEPRVLLLDEPTSSLDPNNQHAVLRLVRHVTAEKGLSTICVVHDLNLAVRYCDRFLFLRDGEVYASGGKTIMTPETIEDVPAGDGLTVRPGVDSTFSDRTTIWKNVLRTWQEEPKMMIIGNGVGHTGSKIVEGTIHEQNGAVAVHNTYLQWAADFGLIGFALMVVFLVIALRQALRVFLAKKRPRGAVAMCMMAAAALAVGMMESATLGAMTPINIVFMFALAQLAGMSREIASR